MPNDRLEDELVWRATKPAFDAVSIYDGPATLARQLATRSEGERALLAIHWCVSEMLNGGFDQFFINPTGLLLTEARAGFERVGLPRAAAILEQAHAIFADRPPAPNPDDPSFDEVEDAERFDAYRARLEPLERQFEAIVGTELTPRLAAYVRGHPEQFDR